MASTSIRMQQRPAVSRTTYVGRRVAICPSDTHFGQQCVLPEIAFPTKGTKSQQEECVKVQLIEHHKDVSRGQEPRTVDSIDFVAKVDAMLQNIQYEDVSQRTADSANQQFDKFMGVRQQTPVEYKQEETVRPENAIAKEENLERQQMNEALAKGQKGTFVSEGNYKCNVCGIPSFVNKNIGTHFKRCLEANPQFKRIYIPVVKEDKKRKLADFKEVVSHEGQSSQQQPAEQITGHLDLRQIMNDALKRGEQGTPVENGKVKCNICEHQDFKRIAGHFNACIEKNPEFKEIYVPKETKKRRKVAVPLLEQTAPIHTQNTASTSVQPDTSIPAQVFSQPESVNPAPLKTQPEHTEASGASNSSEIEKLKKRPENDIFSKMF